MWCFFNFVLALALIPPTPIAFASSHYSQPIVPSQSASPAPSPIAPAAPVYLPVRLKEPPGHTSRVSSESLAVTTSAVLDEATDGSNVVYACTRTQIGRTSDINTLNPVWTPITPTSGIGLGTIRDCVPDPWQPKDKMWVASRTGIWKGENLGASPAWTLVQSTYQTTSTTDGWTGDNNREPDRVIPSITTPGTVFALYTHAGTQTTWIGRSVNDGATWTWSKQGLGNEGTQADDVGFAVAPGSGTVWATTTQNRLYKSIDGGQTFERTQSLPSSGIGGSNQLSAIYSPLLGNDSSVLYVGGANHLATGFISRTLDGGTTWTSVSPVGNHYARKQYAIAGPAWSSSRLYALASDAANDNDKEELFFSADGGSTWTQRFDFDNAGFGFHVPNVAVNALDENRLYILRDIGSGVLTDTLVFLSNDGGVTWLDKSGNWKSAVGTLDTTVAIWDASLDISLLKSMAWAKSCPFAAVCEALHIFGDPVNSLTGNFTYDATDLSVPVPGGNLAFQRTYISEAREMYTRTLGYGWTHSFDTRLLLPGSPGSVAGQVILQAPSGAQLPFIDHGDGTHSPSFGVSAQLARFVATGPITTYVVTATNQSVYRFDDTGRITSQQDPLGRAISYTYYITGPLQKVFEPNGQRYLQFAYDAQQRLVKVSDSASRNVQFGYDANGDLAVVTDTRGLPWTYAYSGTMHLLTRITDPDGHTALRNEYDSQGRVVRQWNGADQLMVALDFSGGNVITTTDALGNTTVDRYARGMWLGSTNAMGKSITRTYDLNFRPATLVDANGNATQQTWSANGSNPTQVVYAPGISVTQKFDARNNLTQSTGARGFTTTYTYSGTFLTRKTDAFGNTWIYTPTTDGRNLLAAEQAPGGRVTSYQYDSFGQRIAVTDPAANVTRYRYDTLGRVISTTVYAGLPTLERTTLTRYDNVGHVVSTTVNFTITTTQPNYLALYNQTTLHAYDGAGRQVAITDTIGRVTRNSYDSAGRLISTTVNFTTTSSQQNYLGLYNQITRYAYDAVGSRILVTDTLGRVTKTDYDKLNHPVSVTQNYSPSLPLNYLGAYNLRAITGYDAAGNVITQTDALGRVTRTWYDSLNRPITVTHNYTTTGLSDDQTNLTTVTAYDASGNAVASRDPLGRVATFGYDKLNRLISTTNALSGTTRYQYDALGNRTIVTDVLTRAMRFEYDKLNRLITTTFPYTGSVVNTYDAAGNRTRVTDALGHTTVYTYDIAGRLVAESDPVSGTTRYQYDVLGNRIAITDPLGVVTRYEYDIAGHTLVMTQNYTTTGLFDHQTNLVTRYRYDVAGNVISTTTPLSATTVYTYDVLNRLVAQSNPLGKTWRYQYDALGNRTVITDANLQVTTFSYDAANRLTAVFYPTDTVRHQYDAVGNRIVMTDSLGVSTFRYDALNRLAGHTDAFGQIITNTYDAFGNLTNLRYPDGKVVTYTFNANNWLTGVQDWNGKWTTYAYDRAGRVLTATLPTSITTAIQYDDANRITGVTARNAFWTLAAYTYTLDAAGNRVKAVEYLGDTTSINFLPLVMKDYADAGGDGASAPNGNGNTFKSPLPLPPITPQPEPFDSPLPTPALESLLHGGKSGLAALPYSGDVPFDLEMTFLSPIDPPPPCSGGLPAFGTNVVITYTYDALRRLTRADYSSGACFLYAYDAGGNIMQAQEVITSSRITTYTYNAASQLQTLKVDVEATTWYYTFDSNGNLREITPNGTNPANGALRYTYDAVNRLNKIEMHNGSSYAKVAEMFYTGLGSRTRLVAWSGGTPLTTTYTVDLLQSARILRASAGSNATTYLYGLSPLGEFGSQTVYYLIDGFGSIRQAADQNGNVTLARIYEPFGEILAEAGTGTPTFGFWGGQFDARTGLLFVNGRYFDPVTRRFLSPPYSPYEGLFNPSLVLPPLIVLYGLRRSKKYRGLFSIMLVLFGVSVALVACGGTGPGTGSPPSVPGTPSGMPGFPNPQGTSVPTAPPGSPTPSPTATVCPAVYAMLAPGNSPANVRSTPTRLIANIISQLPSGEQANVIGQFGREAAGLWWWRISLTRQGQTVEGWVRSDVVTIVGDAHFPSPKPWISPFGPGVGHTTLNEWCSPYGGTSDNICPITEDNPSGTGHNGIDLQSDNDPGLDVSSEQDAVAGREVYAMADAVILSVPGQPDINGNVSDYWINALHEHPNGNIYWIQYTHFRSAAAGISVGSFVEQGTQLGYYSQVGLSSAPHLHISLKPVANDALGNLTDPTPLIP
jgi:RHS repeat-associated protein